MYDHQIIGLFVLVCSSLVKPRRLWLLEDFAENRNLF